MKNMSIAFLACLLSLLFFWTACEKDGTTFCMNELQFAGTVEVAENVTISIPGATYTGVGAKPFPTVLGDYSGEMRSVIISQTPTETGLDVVLVHYFDDGKGNVFWTDDRAIMTPLNAEMTLFTVYDEMTIVDGTGDFACASGLLINEGEVDFSSGMLDFDVSGKVCGGCD
jgi:hypothetical protein